MAASRQCTRTCKALLSPCAFTSGPNCDITVPSFLVPAFASRPQSLRFSTTTRRTSKIGKTPLTLPPEVQFTVKQPPPFTQSQDAKIGRDVLGVTVDIEGPRGKMSMTLPPYIHIVSDDETRTHTLKIFDAGDKKQKAMWGT